MSTTRTTIHDDVTPLYAAAARTAAVRAGGVRRCAIRPDFGLAHYDKLDDLPTGAALASLGCGNPVAVADLHPATSCSTSDPAAASTSCSRPAGRTDRMRVRGRL